MVILLVLTLPVLVSAYRVQNPSGFLPSFSAVDRPEELVEDLIDVLLLFAGIIAVLFIIIGGFQYIFSGANEELAETGKKTLRNAIIGLVIIILSYVIVNVIVNMLDIA